MMEEDQSMDERREAELDAIFEEEGEESAQPPLVTAKPLRSHKLVYTTKTVSFVPSSK